MTLSIGSWVFQITDPLVLAGIGVLLLVLTTSLLAAWRRLAHRSVPRWAAVSLLNLTATLSLLLLFSPPEVPATAERGAVLVTEGAADHSGQGAAFVMPGAEGEGQGLLEVGQLPLRDPSLGDVRVLGHGLDANEWRSLSTDTSVSFEPPSLESVTDVSWDRSIPVGSPFTVSGRWRSDENRAIVRLLDPMGLVSDETRVFPGETFRLTGRPRASGLAEYRLQVEAQNGVMTDEPVGIEVREGRPVRLAIVQSAPSFETQQLKNWAGDQGSSLTVISIISRDRSISQTVNLDAGAPLELSPDMLAAQELLVMDGRVLASIDPARLGWIEDAVRAGLGLLVLADTDLANAATAMESSLLAGFSLSPTTGESANAVPVWAGMISPGPMPIAPLRLEADQSQALVADESGRPLGLARDLGLGRVAVSILRERHAWLTSGETGVYSAYWSYLLRQIARPSDQPRLRTPDSQDLTLPGGQTPICAERARGVVIAQVKAPSHLDLPDLDWPLSPDAFGSSLACTDWWPRASGWHDIRLLDKDGNVLDQQFRRVIANHEWLGPRRDRRQQATQKRAAQDSTPVTRETQNSRSPLAPTWPWWLFVLSAGLLWLERKLDFEG